MKNIGYVTSSVLAVLGHAFGHSQYRKKTARSANAALSVLAVLGKLHSATLNTEKKSARSANAA